MKNPTGQQNSHANGSAHTKPNLARGPLADGALISHSPGRSNPKTSESTETRLGPPSRTSSAPQSPPPSPEFGHVLPVRKVSFANGDPPIKYKTFNTPPLSRTVSQPLLVPCRTHDQATSGKSDQSNILESDPAITNPFLVSAPYVKPPCFIDYGTNLHIAASTFVNRGLYVIDSPVCSIRIGERCLLGPQVILASIRHPIGVFPSTSCTISTLFCFRLTLLKVA